MKNFLIITATIGVALILFSFFTLWEQQSVAFKVVFLDVGQGDAIFIQTPDRYQVLIDTGATSVITSELGAVMPPWDRSIDLMIITHPDADHFGAVSDVVKQYRVVTIIDNGFYSDPEFDEYKNLVDSEGIEHVVPQNGYQIELPGEAILTFLSVPQFGELDDKNEESIIVRVDYRGASFLFTGDAGIGVEQELVKKYPELVDVDILKLGHHGSKTSTSGLFLQATSPSIGITSAGSGNKFGHPHGVVLGLLEDFAIAHLCTCDVGRIIFKYKNDQLFIKY